MTGPTREELDAKLAASEARAEARMTGLFHQFEGRLFQHIDAKLDAIDGKFAAVDAKFAGMESRFGNVDSKLSGMQTDIAVMNNRMASIEDDVLEIRGFKKSVITSGISVAGTVIATGIAVVGVIQAYVDNSGQSFGLGIDVSAVVEQAAERAVKAQAQSASAIAEQAAERVLEKQALDQPVKSDVSVSGASSK